MGTTSMGDDGLNIKGLIDDYNKFVYLTLFPIG
jgi:hypothetical protein